jgi:cytochrome c
MSVKAKMAAGVLAVVAVGGVCSAVMAQQAAPAPKTVWSGVYTSAQATRGRLVYNAQCAVCHGAGLQGADVNPALAGAQFTSKWRGQTVGALSNRIRTTMPLDNPGSLTASATADLSAYLLMRNRYPAGATELPRVAAQQNAIRITER